MMAVRPTTTFQRVARALMPSSLLAAALLAAAPSAAPAAPLVTALTDPTEAAFGEADPDGALAAARDAGARVLRAPVFWSQVAPSAPRDATDPADPAYRFAPLDATVRGIVAAGMEPMLIVQAAPAFARVRGPSPDPGDLAAFMTALARRYAGDFRELPRVRLFILWNEVNLKTYLDQGDAPAHYRAMLRAAYPAIHAVREDNVVVGGALAPFAGPAGRYGTAPLPFMRELLSEPAPFDVWSVHPYTSGPPARRAANRGDVSIGDLPAVRRILRATGHARKPLWVTEISWDSAPPDPYAVPVREHARWVAEGLYRMWRSGVRLVVWFQLRDNPRGTFTWGQTWQSGLFFRTTDRYADERPKPALLAYRFPFVALPARRGVTVWGRTPGAVPARVVVERRAGRRWRRVATLRADRDGIFRRRLRGHRGAVLRARTPSAASLPFAARRTRMRFVHPFGGSALP
jgi:hypothetical protein